MALNLQDIAQVINDKLEEDHRQQATEDEKRQKDVLKYINKKFEEERVNRTAEDGARMQTIVDYFRKKLDAEREARNALEQTMENQRREFDKHLAEVRMDLDFLKDSISGQFEAPSGVKSEEVESLINLQSLQEAPAGSSASERRKGVQKIRNYKSVNLHVNNLFAASIHGLAEDNFEGHCGAFVDAVAHEFGILNNRLNAGHAAPSAGALQYYNSNYPFPGSLPGWTAPFPGYGSTGNGYTGKF
ncbi:hypothetical protein K505DRAFT_332822 [Melanomma pulvis-pyrius CBS 109.77]|uniref:Uncharacterized protein n=1 Tax=Melanomma pulvis-pyrius CBS 109.77 TaxID=1314802 RepID=A0A6A6XSF3_9PLEO|nr:hypothetical protein K505DRAFT_332822 [Melanomma pulvis-pyrius CBS 109.77]